MIQIEESSESFKKNFKISRLKVIMMIIGWTLSLVTLTAVFIGFYFILVAKSDFL